MKILGSRVDNITMQEALMRINEFIRDKSFAHIVTLNAEIAYIASENAELRQIINKAALVTPDGSGIVWAAEKLGGSLKERVTGIDLMLALCGEAAKKGYKIFLLGGEEGVADEAAAALKKQFPLINICGSYHGFFLKEEHGRENVMSMLKKSAPDLLFVAMGAPKQEFLIDEFKESLSTLTVMGVGGSFDVIAGRVKRAPLFVQKMHLEWLWRTVLQPSRWKRTLRLPLFMRAVKKQAKEKQTKNING